MHRRRDKEEAKVTEQIAEIEAEGEDHMSVKYPLWKKEYRALSLLWTNCRDYADAKNELNQCLLRLRLGVFFSFDTSSYSLPSLLRVWIRRERRRVEDEAAETARPVIAASALARGGGALQTGTPLSGTVVCSFPVVCVWFIMQCVASENRGGADAASASWPTQVPAETETRRHEQ